LLSQYILIFSNVIVLGPSPQLDLFRSPWEGCQPAEVSPAPHPLLGGEGAGSGGRWGGWAVGGAGGREKADEEDADTDQKKNLSTHCVIQPSIKLAPVANKQEMVSHVVKPKVRRSPKATSLRNEALANPKACAQAVFVSHQRGRPCLTKCALAQADISRQELEASLSGLFVRLGVEQ
jgi:hypothetical protein